MSNKAKNKRKAAGDSDSVEETASNEVSTTPAKTLTIPKTIKPLIETFNELKELAYLVERHYDRYTDSEEKASLKNVLSNLTELNVSKLTGQLNDIESSQAAMLIRQIIKDHTLLERVHLQDNAFSPPDLQFILKALIYACYGPEKKYLLNQVNLGNSVSLSNLERSGAELMLLRKTYGNNIILDKLVYDYFIQNYRKATLHYLVYLAKKIILPKAGRDTHGTEIEITQTADKVIQEGLPEGTKNKIRFETAVKKYTALKQLNDILHSTLPEPEIFEKFQTQYKAAKKIFAKTINKDDDAHLDRFYHQIGDVKPQSFIPVKKDSRSIFKPEPKKKKRGKKTSARAAKKKVKTSEAA